MLFPSHSAQEVGFPNALPPSLSRAPDNLGPLLNAVGRLLESIRRLLSRTVVRRRRDISGLLMKGHLGRFFLSLRSQLLLETLALLLVELCGVQQSAKDHRRKVHNTQRKKKKKARTAHIHTPCISSLFLWIVQQCPQPVRILMILLGKQIGLVFEVIEAFQLRAHRTAAHYPWSSGGGGI